MHHAKAILYKIASACCRSYVLSKVMIISLFFFVKTKVLKQNNAVFWSTLHNLVYTIADTIINEMDRALQQLSQSLTNNLEA
ncbi:hypothetical protein D9M68_885710 [compost metagenome]